MSTFDEKLQEIKESIENTQFTPETLAWTLITDDECSQINQGQIIFFDDNKNLSLDEQVEEKFQILLTIYFEMLFGWYKLLHLMSLETNQDNLNEEFKPDLNNITLEDLSIEFIDKIKILGFILYVKELSDDEHFNQEYTNCYCRVLLRDSSLDENYFYLKRYQLDPEKRYTFIRNGKFKLNENIKKYSAVIKLPKKSFKIYFDRVI